MLLNGIDKKTAYHKAEQWLNKVGISDAKLYHLANQLSGGQFNESLLLAP